MTFNSALTLSWPDRYILILPTREGLVTVSFRRVSEFLFLFSLVSVPSTATMASSSGNDDDLTIPRAAINKMIKETLPNVRVANDARELVVNCCTEFIHLISSEANDICNKSEKKTISPEHVINGKSSFVFPIPWKSCVCVQHHVMSLKPQRVIETLSPLAFAPQRSRASVSHRTSRRWKTSCRSVKLLLWRGGRPARDWRTWASLKKSSSDNNRNCLQRYGFERGDTRNSTNSHNSAQGTDFHTRSFSLTLRGV